MTKREAVLRWAELAWVAASEYPSLGMTAGHLLAIVERESGGNPNAGLSHGYRGLMQVGKAVTDDWADDRGVPSPWPDVLDPETNLVIGAWFLAWCRKRAGELASASVDQYGVKPPLVLGDRWPWAMAIYAWGFQHVKKAVQSVYGQLSRPVTIDDMARHMPDAGKPNVRPWYRAKVYPREVEKWNEAIEGIPLSTSPILACASVVPLASAFGLTIISAALLARVLA